MKSHLTILSLSLVLISAAFAQNPGGVSASSTNKLWLDAYRMGGVNGSPISQWTDYSGNAAHAKESSVSRRPTYQTAGVNGMPSIHFDGVDDYMYVNANPIFNSNKSTHFVVYETSSINAGSNMLFNMDFLENTQLIYTSAFPTYSTSYVKNTLNQVKAVNFPVAPTNKIVSNLWDGVAGTYQGYHNGTSAGIKVGATNTATGHKFVRIGAFNTNYKFHGSIAEIIYYTSVLNSAQHNIVENYLAAKFGIAIAGDLYTHDATHKYDVIGVGQEASGNNLTASGLSNLDLTVGSMANGEYVLVGHNNAGYTANTTDIPIGYNRYTQVWKSTVTGYGGTVDLAFDVTTNALGTNTAYKLLVDGDGVFASGATEYAGVYNSGIVTFTGVTLTSSSYFTLANSDFQVISTGVTNDWHLTTTWTCGCIPTSGSNATILAAHSVFINGQNAAVGNLAVAGTLSFSSTDTLVFNGNLTNTGTLTAGTGTLNFGGSVAQQITGAVQLNNLSLNNAAGLTLNAATSVQGWLNVGTGTLATGNNLTLLSNASGTAAVKNPTAGTVSGNVTVQRYLNEGESWYLLAPAVVGGNLEDWNQEFEMQGFTGTEWPGGTPSVYYYDQNFVVTNYNQGYKKATNTATVIDIKSGWYAYVGDDTKATGARSINITGTLGLGDYAITCLHVIKSGDAAQDGWSLIANPYAAPVKWLDVTRTGLFDEAQYKKADGSWVTMDNSFVLGSGEAFWVHYNVGAGGDIQFQPADVSTSITDNYNLRTAQLVIHNEPTITIALNDVSANYNDYCYVGFSDLATNDKDMQIDAYKLPQSNRYLPNIATVMQGNNLLKNVMNSSTDQIVPIKIYVTNPSNVVKNYTLSFSNIKEVMDYNKSMVLEDRTLNTFTTLLNDTKIDFSMADNNSNPRFFLHISTPILFTAEQVTCFGKSNGSVTASINTPGNYSFIWKDETGNVIKSAKNTTSSNCSGLTPGNYVLEVDNFKQKFTITQPEQLKANFATSTARIDDINVVSTEDNDTLTVNAGELISFNSESENQTSNNWDFGDMITSNLESSQHIYFNTGLYKVTLTSKNNTCESENYKYVQVNAATSIAETNLLDEVTVSTKENDIFVYMNNQTNTGNVKFEVLNAVGQIIYSTTKIVGNNHIETIHLDEAAGLYFINIEGFNHTKTKKIVLN